MNPAGPPNAMTDEAPPPADEGPRSEKGAEDAAEAVALAVGSSTSSSSSVPDLSCHFFIVVDLSAEGCFRRDILQSV